MSDSDKTGMRESLAGSVSETLACDLCGIESNDLTGSTGFAVCCEVEECTRRTLDHMAALATARDAALARAAESDAIRAELAAVCKEALGSCMSERHRKRIDSALRRWEEAKK
jgi:hypothetical protein